MRAPRLVLVACLASGCFGCAFAPPRLENSPVVVTEVHFDPSDEQPSGEYIEIGNIGDGDVDISGWEVTGAGRVAVPEGTVLAARDALLLCEDKEICEIMANRKLSRVVIFDGKLKNGGETIRIETADGLIADEVRYEPDLPEVQPAEGTGMSLHRIDPDATGEEEGTWKAGPPTPGRFGRG